MKLRPIALAVALAYGRQSAVIESAAWLWFDWTRGKDGRLSYRWKL